MNIEKKINEIFKEAKRDFKMICSTHKLLEKTYDIKLPIHSAGQWILDNMYIIEQEYEEIKDVSKVLRDKRLPAIKDENGDRYISVYYLAYELVEQNMGQINSDIILNCLKEHQKLSYLSSEELDLFVLMLRIALLKFIARIALNITNSQVKKIEVEKILQLELNNKDNRLHRIYNQASSYANFKDSMSDSSKIKTTNTAFVEYMSYRLKEEGLRGDKYFKVLEDEAQKIGFSIDEAIIKEHMEIAKTTDYVGRAILSFKQLQGLNFREIFEKVNKIDETLKQDYTNEFKKCDYKTKGRYRSYIIFLAKKYKMSEVYIAKKAVECSKKYKKHVGFFLIGEEKYLLKKEINKPYKLNRFYYNVLRPLNPRIYIFLILAITIAFTILFNNSILSNTIMPLNILFNVIAFFFILEVTMKIIDYILRKTVRPRFLPRFDFAKTIDAKYPTYVVMPTVITSLEKLDSMIEKMEVTYLANRSENMYYMLLGDCMSSDKEHIDVDDKIVEFAKTRLEDLNKKYNTEHKLFNFMYRKRVYSKSESSYIGWERKRGALEQFNKVVLGKMNKQEIDKAFYLIYDDIMTTKYAITVDEDTQLSLNTAKDLVAIISHPLNAPVLSKNKKRVIKGYGIIQPSIGLDIEAANKSIFSKIFGGFGGLDIYTNAVCDVYQDTFREAIFGGKGIYNVELFETLLADEIPENLVLSHDLLESSFLKAGLASDIELQDGFPKNYIAYVKRLRRWHRGDMQIIKWLINPKSKLSMLSKWKIFDNLRRPLLDVMALIYILVSLFISPEVFAISVLVSFATLNFGILLGIVDRMIFGTLRYTKDIQYIPLINGIDADILTMTLRFVTMPYLAVNCIIAFTLSIYRMLISKRNLLQWTTGEMLEFKSKDSLSYYYINMIPNIVIGLIVLFLPNGLLTEYISIGMFLKVCVGISFILAPILAYLLGKDHLFGRKNQLNKKQKEQVLDVAKRTWDYFDTLMNATNNYLPTDNFQENRRYKIANRTSATDIGFGLLAIVNAYDFKFIGKHVAVEKIKNTFETIAKLDKWNGHLYNWYNIKTLESLRPRFVSTIDSGNFIACLYVIKQFLIEISKDSDFEPRKDLLTKFQLDVDTLLDMTETMIKETDFTLLYNNSRNLFSIGYAQENGTLVDSYYDMLMSESRTTSLIAIANRQVTSKHWFALARNLVKVDGYKGLMSWSGTAFEYYMPNIFNKYYEHTLIDQSLFFTKYSQIKFANKNNVAWGVSESAYAIKDNELNYQYKAFGVPWLGLKRGLNDSLVVSPYSSILMIEEDPIKVVKNLKKFKDIGMYSTFGFYESIDYTKDNLIEGETSEIIKTYMAHHQGMILSAINNYINDGKIRNRFHKNPEIKATEILLKERERIKANIKKKVKDKDNVFKQKNTSHFTTYVSYTGAVKEHATKTDESTKFATAFLKGSNLSTIITNSGDSYLSYKKAIVNKQRFVDTKIAANYVFLTDKTTGNTISATDCNIHSKNNENTKVCTWKAHLNKVECYIEDDNIETTTQICLSPEYNIEMKKITMYNNSNLKREIVIKTYLEPAMTDYMTNVVHPSFSNLQIETYYDEELDVIIASKRKKTQEDTDLFIYSKLVGIDLEKDVETEKIKLVKEPDKAYDGEVSRYPLWPVLSYRATIILDPYERQDFYYLLGVATSKYKISNAIVNLDKEGIETQFKLSTELNSVIARYLKLEPTKAEIYNNILNELLFPKEVEKDEKYWNSSLKKSDLWKYSISGDYPILLVYINKIEEAVIVKEVIRFMEYVKNRKVNIDIVVLIDEKETKEKPTYTYIKENLDRAIYTEYTKGNIYTLNVNELTKEDVRLLSFLSKKYISNIDDFLYFKTSEDIKKTKEVKTSEVTEHEN